MTDNSTSDPKYSISPNCPPGMLVERNGEIMVTPMGMGYLAAEGAKDLKMSLVAAIGHVSECVGNYYGGLLGKGYPEAVAKIRSDEMLSSAKMRLEEIYRGSGLEGGRA